MTRRALATAIACALVGAWVTFTFVSPGFSQKTAAAGKAANDKPEIAVGRYQGAVNAHGNLYLFDTATGAAWMAAIDPSKPDGKWSPIATPIDR